MFRNRSSGKRAKSLIASVRVSEYRSERIQPTWLHQNPSWSGEWMSAGWSDSRWWCRWFAAHQSTPFWAEVSAKKASRNWNTRDVLKDRCAK